MAVRWNNNLSLELFQTLQQQGSPDPFQHTGFCIISVITPSLRNRNDWLGIVYMYYEHRVDNLLEMRSPILVVNSLKDG